MATTASEKAKILKNVTSELRKNYSAPPKKMDVTVLEHLVLAVLAEDSVDEKAREAFGRLKQEYFDWNEVRVSAVVELRELLSEFDDADERCSRLKTCLKHIFELLYSFDLEAWKKLAQKEVTKKLSAMPSPSQYVTARVIRDGLSGNAMPIDDNALRVITRLGLFDENAKHETVAGSMERLLPRAKGYEFIHWLSELAIDRCHEKDPRCRRCCLKPMCPTGIERSRPARKTAAKKKTVKKAAKSKTTAKATGKPAGKKPAKKSAPKATKAVKSKAKVKKKTASRR